MTLVAKEVKKVYVWRGRLPSEYQEVERIRSSGTQYIDTTYTPWSYPTIDVTFELLWWNSNTWLPIYWRRYSWWQASWAIALFVQSSSLYITPNYWTFDPWTSWWVTISKNVKYNVVNDKWQFYIDWTLKTSLSTSNTLSSSGWHLWLFETNDSGTALGRNTQMKLYACKLYNNWTLERDFVPCYRKSDSVIGMYDLVNGVFYTNAGSGTFTKGNDVLPTEIQVRPTV